MQLVASIGSLELTIVFLAFACSKGRNLKMQLGPDAALLISAGQKYLLYLVFESLASELEKAIEQCPMARRRRREICLI